MKGSLRVAIVGLLMGAAEVVPGVSGGTIAFVSGLYERLVDAVRQFTPSRLLEVRHLGVAGLWRKMDINFLLALFGAMGVSIILLARGISYLLEQQPVFIWSFFFGLVVASVWVMGKKLRPFDMEAAMALAVGAAVGLAIVRLAPVVAPTDAAISPLVLFAGGCVAVCAWILPGLSGSFILLILGLYQTVIVAVKEFDLPPLLYLGLGCAVGLVAFSQVLGAVLARFHKVTIAMLTGFMLGSLARIWPWRYTTVYQLKPDGGHIPVVQEPVWPQDYEYLTGQAADIGVALLAMVVGAGLVLALDYFSLLQNGQRGAVADENR